MIQQIEDITVISAAEFVACQEDMLFVDTASPFPTQPMVQVYLALGETETELPTMWQESSIFGGDVVHTYEAGAIHTFISTDFTERLEEGMYLFIKVLAIGEMSS